MAHVGGGALLRGACRHRTADGAARPDGLSRATRGASRRQPLKRLRRGSMSLISRSAISKPFVTPSDSSPR